MMATNATNDGEKRKAKGDDYVEQPKQETIESGELHDMQKRANHEVK